MKKGWERKQIGDLCEVIAGQSPEGKFYNNDGKGMPFYQGKKDFGEKFIEAPTTWTTQTTKIAREGDILMSVRAPVGPVNFATDEACIGRGLAAIRSRAELNRDFLFYQLLHLQPEIAGKEGAVFASINKSEIEALPITFALLPEQQRIVGILDEAFEGIATAKANAEKNLQNARALFESHLQSVFTQRGEGWVEKRLGVLSRINYGYTESASADKVGPKFLRITDIQNNQVDWSNVPYCPIEDSDYPKYKLAHGDIVFARTGATTGKSYLVTKPPEAVFASYLIRVQLSTTELLPPFLNLFFMTQTYWDSIRSGTSGSAQGGFNATKLGELVIPFPISGKQQQSIVAKFDALSEETQRLESIYQQKLTALEELKKSLLHQAFSGVL